MELKSANLSRDERAFRLDWNTDHIYDVDVDGWLIPFAGAPDNSAFWRIKERIDLPERVEFDAIGPILDDIDYPYTDVRWPIMSKRMLNALLSVGNFHHIAYPVVMTDCKEIYDPNTDKYYQPRIENHNYLAVHVLEDLDIIDLEKSIYGYSRRNPSRIDSTSFKKVVFKELERGFPSLFRVPPLDTRLYISAEAKAALEAAEIRGVDFIQVENNYTVVKALP